MRPVLFSLGSLPVSGYWGVTMLALLVSYTYLQIANRRSGEEKLPWYHLNNICCLCILSIYIGGALMGLATSLPQTAAAWKASPGDLRALWDAAFANRGFYGGLILLTLTLSLYVRHYGLSGQGVTALFLPVCPLFMVFGRLACFMGGCCYGVPVSWGVVFPEGSLAPAGIPLFPSQLAEAAGHLLLFGWMLWLKGRVKQRYFLIVAYTGAYAILRFVLEFWRGDLARRFYGPLSTSQWLSLAVLLSLILGSILYKRKEMRCSS